MTESHERLLATYGAIGRRSSLSASYLAANALVLLHVAEKATPAMAAAFTGVAFVVAIVVSHGAYETIMPLHRRISARFVVRGFVAVQGNGSPRTYDDLRVFKRHFLISDAPQNLKSELTQNIALRQQLTYLFSSALVAVPLVGLVALVSVGLRSAVFIQLAVAVLVLVSTTVGHISRSKALGRSYGHAWSHANSNRVTE